MGKQILISIIFLAMIPGAACRKEPSMTYPVTKKIDQNDDYFGTKVADPYRWLEDDKSAETAEWVEAQNAVTNAYLEKIPYRNSLKERLTA